MLNNLADNLRSAIAKAVAESRGEAQRPALAVEVLEEGVVPADLRVSSPEKAAATRRLPKNRQQPGQQRRGLYALCADGIERNISECWRSLLETNESLHMTDDEIMTAMLGLFPDRSVGRGMFRSTGKIRAAYNGGSLPGMEGPPPNRNNRYVWYGGRAFRATPRGVAVEEVRGTNERPRLGKRSSKESVPRAAASSPLLSKRDAALPEVREHGSSGGSTTLLLEGPGGRSQRDSAVVSENGKAVDRTGLHPGQAKEVMAGRRVLACDRCDRYFARAEMHVLVLDRNRKLFRFHPGCARKRGVVEWRPYEHLEWGGARTRLEANKLGVKLWIIANKKPFGFGVVRNEKWLVAIAFTLDEAKRRAEEEVAGDT